MKDENIGDFLNLSCHRSEQTRHICTQRNSLPIRVSLENVGEERRVDHVTYGAQFLIVDHTPTVDLLVEVVDGLDHLPMFPAKV